MEIRLLGPLEAVDAGAPLALGGTKQRALLAALTLAGGRVVSAARLVDDLWGMNPPDTAPKMVQIHVSALRKVLPADVLVTRAPGYAVDLPRDAVDAFRAEDALRAGRDALAAGDAHGASEALAGALALWRGPALEEFGEPFAEGEARRLAELRLALTEERLAADLALGRHADAIREIDALVAAEPLRERLRELQMVALYRSGRQAEALAAYQDAFRALNEELGIEPSARLRELERAVLRQDPSLDAPAAPAPAPGPLTPPGVAPIGRDAELTALRAELAAAAEGATRVVLVTGEAGAGKTTLVDALLDGLPDGAALVGRGQCVVQHGPSEAYMPVLQALERICRAPGAGDALPALAARAPTWMAQLPWLLDDAGRAAVEARLVGANRDRMLREGVEAITELSVARPVVLVVEDLQWSDLATVDLIAALGLHRGPARLVVLATMRPPDAAPGDAIQAAARDLVARGLATEIAVGGLGDAAVARYLASRLPGAGVPADLAASLRARTGGIPLFLEKAVDGWIEDGRAVREDGAWALTADAAALSRDIPFDAPRPDPPPPRPPRAGGPPAAGDRQRRGPRVLGGPRRGRPRRAGGGRGGAHRRPRARRRDAGARRRGALARRDRRRPLRIHPRPLPRGAVRRPARRAPGAAPPGRRGPPGAGPPRRRRAPGRARRALPARRGAGAGGAAPGGGGGAGRRPAGAAGGPGAGGGRARRDARPPPARARRVGAARGAAARPGGDRDVRVERPRGGAQLRAGPRAGPGAGPTRRRRAGRRSGLRRSTRCAAPTRDRRSCCGRCWRRGPGPAAGAWRWT